MSQSCEQSAFELRIHLNGEMEYWLKSDVVLEEGQQTSGNRHEVGFEWARDLHFDLEEYFAQAYQVSQLKLSLLLHSETIK